MAETIALWHAEHVNFSRLLDLLETQLAAFHDGESPDYDLVLDIVEYLHEYPDHYHHPREDVAFARLVEHDPAMRLPTNRLLQEHRVIAAAGNELQKRLNEIVDGALVERAAVEAAAATYVAYYRHHLATEERDILPRAAKMLTPQDWAAVDKAAPPGKDPLFGETPEERYRMLYRRIEERRARP